MPEHFRERLAARQKKIGSALCVGLDPQLESLPSAFKRGSESANVLAWMQHVVDATSPFASMFKLQRAYYEALPEGEQALRTLTRYIAQNYPDIPIFLDVKRGDIDRTQLQYRTAVFEQDGGDGANVCSYMGSTPFLNMFDPAQPERAIVNLIYTSNPGAREIQDARMHNGDPLWLFMAKRTLVWIAECGAVNAGFVMAAAYKKDGCVYAEHLRVCRELDNGVVWYLMPGFGTQGGIVEESVLASWKGYGSIALNASSSICNAPDPAQEAEKLHLAIKEPVLAAEAA